LSYGTNIVSRQIFHYNSTIRYAFVDPPFPSNWNVSDDYTLRLSPPNEKWKLDIATAGLVITLPLGASNIYNYYVGKYIYNTSFPCTSYTIPSIYPPGIYGQFYITKYEGSTRKATVLPDYDDLPLPTIGDIINIVSFEEDNFQPIDYIGSMASVNESVCYEISLVNLTLPNLELLTGSRITFYPYVYIELSNTTTPTAASKSLIYSNNPPSNKALFIASVRDIVDPLTSAFVKMDSGTMVQTIKFKPNSYMRFSVYMPDGNLFKTILLDYESPYKPNNRLQISALFSLKRLN